MQGTIFFQTLLLIIFIILSYKFLISSALHQIRKVKRLRSTGIKVEGKIINNKTSINTDGGKEYYPLVEYFINDTAYQILSVFPKSEPGLIGGKIEVICDSKDPENAIINKPSPLATAYYVVIFWVIIVFALMIALIFGKTLQSTSGLYP